MVYLVCAILFVFAYFVIVTILIENQGDEAGLRRPEFRALEDRKAEWWEVETIESLRKQIADAPDDPICRYKFCLMMPTEHVVEWMEHASWLIERFPGELSGPETRPFDYNPRHRFARRARSAIQKYRDSNLGNIRALQMTAEVESIFDREKSLEWVAETLSRDPNDEALVQWAAFRYLISDQRKSLERAAELYRQRSNMSWRDGMTARLRRLKGNDHNPLIPNWIFPFVLSFHGFFYPRHPFDNCLELARYGEVLQQLGTKSECAEIEDRIIPLLDEAMLYCWHPPLMSDTLNFLAVQALRRKNFAMLEYYLGLKLKNEVKSEFDFLFNDREFIEECIRSGHRHIAVDFMTKAAAKVMTDESVRKVVDAVERGDSQFDDHLRLEADPQAKIRTRIIGDLKTLSTVENLRLDQEHQPFLNLIDRVYSHWFETLKLPNSLIAAESKFSGEESESITRFLDRFAQLPEALRDPSDPNIEEFLKSESGIAIVAEARKLHDQLTRTPRGGKSTGT